MDNFFDKHYERYDAWYEENRFAYLSELETLKKVLPAKGYGLEIGVGSGRFAAPLGVTVGIDPSKKMVELARARGVDARLGSGEELPFKNSIFDYIAIIVTLCFVRDPGKVIRKSAKVLKSGGKIIIGVIDKDSFLGRAYREKESIFYDQAHFLKIKEIIRLLETSGFEDFSFYQTLFDHPDRMDVVQIPLKGYGKGGFVVISAVKK